MGRTSQFRTILLVLLPSLFALSCGGSVPDFQSGAAGGTMSTISSSQTSGGTGSLGNGGSTPVDPRPNGATGASFPAVGGNTSSGGGSSVGTASGGSGGTGGGSSVGGSTGGGGSNAVGGGVNAPLCNAPSDCPGEDTECKLRRCDNGGCGFELIPDGVVVARQTAGDCQLLVCDGNGSTKSRIENQDLPVDGDACTRDACTAGVPSNPRFEDVACALPADHLLLSEVKYQPLAQEFIEIYNPTGNATDLTNYWLADYNTYYLVTSGEGAPVSWDFRVRFPTGTSIGARSYLVVSLASATEFKASYGFYPDFDLDTEDAHAPDMVGQFSGSSGLADTGEMVMLFYWNGTSTTVRDVDYVVFNTGQATDKSLVPGYQHDTPMASQILLPTSSISLQRCDFTEASEIKISGNGITGHDETSEAGMQGWKASTASFSFTPKAAPPIGLCP